MNPIAERIKQHIGQLFRLFNDGKIIFRDITSRNAYGEPQYTETIIPTRFYIRVYRVRGLEPTTLGEVSDRNFIATIPHLSTFPRQIKEDDLLEMHNQKYRIIAATPYVIDGEIVAYTALCRIYKGGN